MGDRQMIGPSGELDGMPTLPDGYWVYTWVKGTSCEDHVDRIFAANRESARDVYSKRRIVAVTKLEIVNWHNYKHLDWITVPFLIYLVRDETSCTNSKEGGDFKDLHSQTSKTEFQDGVVRHRLSGDKVTKIRQELMNQGIDKTAKDKEDYADDKMELNSSHPTLYHVTTIIGAHDIGGAHLVMRQLSNQNRRDLPQGYLDEIDVEVFLRYDTKVAYKLELPEELSNVHNTFHVYNLNKCLSDESLVIPMKELQLNVKLNFVEEPVEIIDQEVKQLKQSRIPIVKVRWNSKRGPEFT
ncbi:hypothetical protein Tco_0846660 [Tanacetum coccineum]